MLVEGDAAKKLQTSFVEDLRPFLLPVHSQAFVLLRSCCVLVISIHTLFVACACVLM